MTILRCKCVRMSRDTEYGFIVIFDQILIRLCALLLRICHCERVYSLFCCDTTLLRVVVNGIFKKKRDVRKACCVYYTKAAEWVASLARACRAGLNCVGRVDESRGALWGERKKFPRRRGRTTHGAPAIWFLSLWKTFPATLFAFWLRNTAFAFQRKVWLSFLVKAPAPWSYSASKWTPSYELVLIRIF